MTRRSSSRAAVLASRPRSWHTGGETPSGMSHAQGPVEHPLPGLRHALGRDRQRRTPAAPPDPPSAGDVPRVVARVHGVLRADLPVPTVDRDLATTSVVHDLLGSLDRLSLRVLVVGPARPGPRHVPSTVRV